MAYRKLNLVFCFVSVACHLPIAIDTVKMGRGVLLASCCLLFWLGTEAQKLQPATVTSLSPKGVRFVIQDVAGASLMTVHYSINEPVIGVKTAQYNFNIQSKIGNVWVHDNRYIDVKTGDVVYYWLYTIANNEGSYLTDQSYMIGGGVVTAIPTAAIATQNNIEITTTKEPVKVTPRPRPVNADDDLSWNPVRLVMKDEFDEPELNRDSWDFDVSMGGDFAAFTPAKENAYIKKGVLHIRPSLTADKYSEAFLKHGLWNLNKEFGVCTYGDLEGPCSEDARESGMLPPVMSARIKSKAGIKYGKVEIVAKMAKGDWLYPELIMVPKDFKYGFFPRSGAMSIAEVRGNLDFGTLGVSYMTSRLYFAPTFDLMNKISTAVKRKAESGTFADRFHKYTLLWDKHGIEMLLDDERVAKYNTPPQGYWRAAGYDGENIWPNSNSPFDEEFDVVVGVGVGGINGIFPDGIYNVGYGKPWMETDERGDAREKFWNARKHWLETWKGDDAALQIESVAIYQLL